MAPRGQVRYDVTLLWVMPFADTAVFANPVILGILDRVFLQEYKLVQLATDIPLQGSEYQEIHRGFRPLFSAQFVALDIIIYSGLQQNEGQLLNLEAR